MLIEEARLPPPEKDTVMTPEAIKFLAMVALYAILAAILCAPSLRELQAALTMRTVRPHRPGPDGARRKR